MDATWIMCGVVGVFTGIVIGWFLGFVAMWRGWEPRYDNNGSLYMLVKPLKPHQ